MLPHLPNPNPHPHHHLHAQPHHQPMNISPTLTSTPPIRRHQLTLSHIISTPRTLPLNTSQPSSQSSSFSLSIPSCACSSTHRCCLGIYIMSALTTREQYRCATISKMWLALLSPSHTYTRIELYDCSPSLVTDDLVLKHMRTRSIRCTTLRLRFCSSITNRTVELACRLLPSLTELDLEGCGRTIDSSAIPHLMKCTHLTTLILDGCSRVSNEVLVPILRQCTELRALSLNGLSSIDDAMLYVMAETRLVHLRLNSCSRITDTGITRLVSRLGTTSLRSLSLNYCAKITDAGIVQIAQNCPHLIELNLYGVSSLTDAGLSSLSSLSHLRKLDLSQCRSITHAGIAAWLTRIIYHPHPLEWLSLYDCIHVSLQAIQLIIVTCQHLSYISLFGLPCINAQGMITVLSQASPKLRRVDVGGCSALPPAEIDALAARFPHIRF